METPAIPLSSPVELAAFDPARNVRRRYAISITPDLFGAYIVETRWGRIGTRGQSKCFSFPDRDQADRYIAAETEEHTSELQSLMRISYAVFCLTKKQKPHTNNTT